MLVLSGCKTWWFPYGRLRTKGKMLGMSRIMEVSRSRTMSMGNDLA
jgi:hypothetical protein